MIEHYARPLYQKLLIDPLVNRISDQYSPLLLTMLAGLMGILVLPLLLLGHTALAIISLLLSGYLDSLDGSYARKYGKSTPMGSVADIVTDRIVEICVIFALFAQMPIERGGLAMGMLAANLLCITSFLVIGVFVKNNGVKGFHYSRGIMERAESFVFYIVMMAIPAWFAPLAVAYIILVLLTAFVHLINFSMFQRKL